MRDINNFVSDDCFTGETEDPATYTFAELIGRVTGEDVNAMSLRSYRLAGDILIDQTDAEDRNYFYRTGIMRGTLQGFNHAEGRRI